MRKYLQLVFLAVSVFCSEILLAESRDPVRILDLRTLNELDLKEQEKAEQLWDIMHTTATLQGIVNRNSPRLYIRYVKNGQGENVDDYWWNKYRQAGQWLAGRDTIAYTELSDVVTVFRKEIRGVVVYDSKVASTSNIASSVAGIENLIAVRYDISPNSLYTRLVLQGPKLAVKCWLVNKDGSSLFTGKGRIAGTGQPSTGSLKIDPYVWFIEKYLKTGKCNTEFAAYYIDQYWKQRPFAAVKNHHTLSNHDFFVSKRAFFFDLSPWGDEPATDEPSQPVGTDLNTLKEMLLLAYQQNKNEKMCYIGGFPSWAYKYTMHASGIHDDVPTEWEFSRIISAYNAFKDADAISYGALANASFWQHFPTKKKYAQDWISRKELQKRGLLTADGKVNVDGRNFIIFYVGDYDASAWISQRTPSIWDDPNRGKLPLMWCISPVLAERVPHIMHNFRTTATPNDYFASADNGAGYIMPGMLQEPRGLSGLPSGLEVWGRHCKKYYEKWGLSVTGFVIDGQAPGLNKEGLDCYASFSPNGIVPQKVVTASLHGNMPVIRADLDINDDDPKVAAARIVKRVKERSALPFHWFRNILKQPTWYCEVMDEVKSQDENIVLLDAPAFFELLRIYLKEHDSVIE